MSSTYLTNDDMRMIERLLAEVREPSRAGHFDRETAAARFLFQNFERKRTTEADLRSQLAARIKTLDTMSRAFGTRHDDRGLKMPCGEAQRRIDNDTDGTRRRASEIKRRNSLI